MSTDHTNGSSWDAASDPVTHQAFVLPIVDAPVAGGPEVEGEQLSLEQLLAAIDCEQDQEHPETDASTDSAQSAEMALRESLREDVAEAMEFRVARPGTPIRRLRLTGNRYTLGSAEGCSIRLNDHDIRPMHAVLIRDGSRILVRAYSIPIEVNEHRITETELYPGDRLQLGSYRFELLSSEEADQGSLRTSAMSGRPWESVSETPGLRPLGDLRSPSDRLRGGSAWQLADDVLWKERLRREIDQWRERQLECDRRESRCDQREANLRNRETELWSRAENLHRRESRLQSQEASTLQLYDEFAKRQQELLEAREAARKKEESLHQREVAFRNQEIEYRQRLDEATRQLQLSQEQAETATDAVARMRQQFESLTEQIDALSSQHTEIELREVQQRSEHQRLIDELRKSRDAALEAQSQSEAQRREAEEQVEQLESQLALLRDDRGTDLVANQERLAEAQQIADALRKQVEDLQQSLASATDESARLRTDYEDAVASVLELESIIARTSKNGESDREAWESEADELRASVERLSTELSKANRDLQELRDANAQLTARLDDMQLQRNEARADADRRPTLESFHALHEELTGTKDQLAQAQADREDALQQLNDARREWEREQEAAAQQLADALAAAEASRVAKSPMDESQANEQIPRSSGSSIGETDPGLQHEAIDAADPFDPEPDFRHTGHDQADADLVEEFLIDEESNQSDRDESSDWDFATPSLGDASNDDRDGESMWNLDESQAGINRNVAAKYSQRDSIWGEQDEDSSRLEADQSPSDESSHVPAAGSLAERLIRDLDGEAAHQDPLDPEAEPDVRSYGVPRDGWDQEYTEEAYATRWSNHPEGYRVESIDVSNLDEDADDVSEEVQLLDEAMQVERLSLDAEETLDDAAASLSSQTDSEEEDSIEAYMNRLLRRVQGRPIDEPPAANAVVSAKNVTSKKSPEEPPKKTERLKPDEPLVPRSKAPERTNSLSAMRELANTSARIAISRSVRVQTRDTQLKGMFNLACALGAIACGIACYFYIPGVMRYLAVAMTIVVASIYAYEGCQLFREASRHLKAAQLGHPKSESDASEDSDNEDATSKVT